MLVPVLLFDVNRVKADDSIKNIFYYSSLVILITIAGLRYRIGMDTINYMYDFDNHTPLLKEFSFSRIKYEPLWSLLLSLCKSIVNNFVLFQIIHAIFVNTVIFWFIKKYTIYKFTATFFYYVCFYIYFNAEFLREAFAIGCLLLSYPYFTKEKWVKYYMLAITAVLFHYSALILLIFPLLKKFRFDTKNFFLFLGVSVLLVGFSEQLIGLLLGLLKMIGISERLEIYLFFKLNYKGIIANYILYIFIPAFVIYVNKRLIGQNSFNDLYIIYFAIVFAIVVFDPLFRLKNYMLVFCMVYWTNFIYLFSQWQFVRSLRKVVICFLFIFYITLDFVIYFKDTSEKVNETKFYNRYYPYYSVLSPKKYPPREKLWRVFAGWEKPNSKKK